MVGKLHWMHDRTDKKQVIFATTDNLTNLVAPDIHRIYVDEAFTIHMPRKEKYCFWLTIYDLGILVNLPTLQTQSYAKIVENLPTDAMNTH